MDALVLKLVLTPALIGTASLVGRRFGPAVSGWLVGFPFTSAPIALFLALGHGPGFAATAAAGTMAGTISQAAFSLAYGWLAPRHGWPVAVVLSSAAFAVSTAALSALGAVALSAVPLFALAVMTLVLALYLMPGAASAPTMAAAPPRWDLPARMAVATGFVLLLTSIAPALGARLTGLLAPFPLYAAVLAGFAHHQAGPGPAAAVLRGLLVGLFAFAAFFLVLAELLERGGLLAAFGAAIGVALIVQGGALWLMRRRAKETVA